MRSGQRALDELDRPVDALDRPFRELMGVGAEQYPLGALFERTDHGSANDADLDRVGGLTSCGDEPADVLAGMRVDDDADRRHVSVRHLSDPGTGDRGADAGLDVVDRGEVVRFEHRGERHR